MKRSVPGAWSLLTGYCRRSRPHNTTLVLHQQQPFSYSSDAAPLQRYPATASLVSSTAAAAVERPSSCSVAAAAAAATANVVRVAPDKADYAAPDKEASTTAVNKEVMSLQYSSGWSTRTAVSTPTPTTTNSHPNDEDGGARVRTNRTTAAGFGSLGTPPSSSWTTIDTERHEATQLVDRLLRETRQLMRQPGLLASDTTTTTTTTTANRRQQRHHVIAFSGGVDSSLVAALVQANRSSSSSSSSSQDDTDTDDTHIVQAVLGVSPAVPADQIELARRIARHIGIDLQFVSTTEGTDKDYIANVGQACLACKTHLYSTLQAIADHAHAATATTTNSNTHTHTLVRLYNGTNADDLNDPTRLGLVAADRFGVTSPLRHVSKANVRVASRHLGLPNWNHAASPCLRSRLALGVAATAQQLRRMEQAETFLRHQLSHLLTESSNVRVRLLAHNTACMELDAVVLEQLMERDDNGRVVQVIQDYFVSQLQFAAVQARVFQSGSVATTTTTTKVVYRDDKDKALG